MLAPVYSGLLIPAYTGRETYVGAGSWTPDFELRRELTERLFAGQLRPAMRRAAREGLGRSLPLLGLPRPGGHRALWWAASPIPRVRFGCATVYRVK